MLCSRRRRLAGLESGRRRPGRVGLEDARENVCRVVGAGRSGAVGGAGRPFVDHPELELVTSQHRRKRGKSSPARLGQTGEGGGRKSEGGRLPLPSKETAARLAPNGEDDRKTDESANEGTGEKPNRGEAATAAFEGGKDGAGCFL
ncbi:hypothetical protein THAOC_13679 [Thalassiosira oceanica]|uniref:Uncharacterized protein n=1 Tax=Thalassiosira oceanica TaxID=159749 RepID=K0SGY4_THAOC|nr:hypothetical protein THAOC_13679 [Thalassiosira oceanica]|eukprot:EJK65453.1 hypothetical protein THAOC_13679 [Thalassiosira oceanica]